MEKQAVHVLEALSTYTSKPEQFLSVQDDVAKQLRKTVKRLYDITKSLEASSSTDALSELIIDNFDDEQVWQEIELQNKPVIAEQIRRISKVTASSDFSFARKRPSEQDVPQHIPTKTVQDNIEETHHEEEDDEEEKEAKMEDDSLRIHTDEEDLSEEEREMEELLKKAKEEMDAASDGDDKSDDDDELNDDFELDMSKLKQERRRGGKEAKSEQSPASSTRAKGSMKKRTTVVDDKFFKLADMEMFLDQEDAKEERKMLGRPEDVEESDEEIDYFADVPFEGEDKDLKYEDFFDPPEDNSEKDQAKKNVTFSKQKDSDEDDKSDLDDDGDDDDDDDDDDDSAEGEDVTDVLGPVRGEKSSFEKRQERIKKKISELEEAALAEKPWQLQGEVGGQVRPENSLLEEDLDFEHTTRLAPVITEETTKSLEDIIKQRIKDKAWDDVERKVKSTEAFEYKKKIVLDQEKSKLSLSQIYEQEYLKQQQKEQEEKTDPEHEEIQKMMTSLFIKLDALSNFHYTPKPAIPEVKIVSNLPSITMEEVAPVSVSDANLMAPNEIQEKPKKELKGDTEKTETDRKRERREKKKRQQAYFKHKEEKLRKLEKKGIDTKQSKEKTLDELKKQAGTGKGIKILKEDKPSRLTSSAKFFSLLQDEVTAHIEKKKTVKRKMAKKDPVTKYKL